MDTRLSRCILRFLWCLCQAKAILAARVLALESPLASCKEQIEHKKIPKPKCHPAFRLLWVLISKVVDGWEDLAQVMKPAPVKRWHSDAFRAYWKWKSKLGRLSTDSEMRSLIRRLSRENPLWSPERIRDTIHDMEIAAPCIDTIGKSMVRSGKPRKPSGSWIVLLQNHTHVFWGTDFFSVPTWNFRILYVFIVLEHGRRIVRHFAVTEAPHMAWVVQQLREATPFVDWPKYLLGDSDRIYGHGVPRFLKSGGIQELQTTYRSPWQKDYASDCTSWEPIDVTLGNRLRVESFRPCILVGAS